MNLEDEIPLNQFGQGVWSVDELMNKFVRLPREKQRGLFVSLYCEVWGSELVDSALEQALADCAITTTDPLYTYLRLAQKKTGLKGFVAIPSSANPPEGRLDKAYKLLLCLFRAAYQPRSASEKENPTSWKYWDLSKPETGQKILTQQQEQTEEVYNDPGFRSEFTYIAKLLQSHIAKAEAFRQPSQLNEQSQFDFLSYDQIVDKSLLVQDNRDSCAAGLLRTALERAVAARYQLDEDRARRIVLAVLDRYLQEIYNVSLYS